MHFSECINKRTEIVYRNVRVICLPLYTYMHNVSSSSNRSNQFKEHVCHYFLYRGDFNMQVMMATYRGHPMIVDTKGRIDV